MKKLSKPKKIIFTIIGLLVLVVGAFFVSIPILDSIEHSNLKKLDISQRSIFNEIRKVANNSDKWNYEASCNPVRTGPWATGEYYCSTVISTEKMITSVKELNKLQSKYYPLIENSDKLRHTSELNIQNPDYFGKQFVVSGVEKMYVDKSSGVSCKYSLSLGQSNETFNNFVYGSKIINSPIHNDGGSVVKANTGIVDISLSCKNKSTKPWFRLIK